MFVEYTQDKWRDKVPFSLVVNPTWPFDNGQIQVIHEDIQAQEWLEKNLDQNPASGQPQTLGWFEFRPRTKFMIAFYPCDWLDWVDESKEATEVELESDKLNKNQTIAMHYWKWLQQSPSSQASFVLIKWFLFFLQAGSSDKPLNILS